MPTQLPPLHTPGGTEIIDPLSRHILQRTNTDSTIPARLRTAIAQTDGTSGNWEGSSAIQSVDASIATAQFKEPIRTDSLPQKKKGVSFLGSLFGGKKKDDAYAHSNDDSESEHGDLRTEGMNAEVFQRTRREDANGFIPIHKAPPRYIKVRVKSKKEQEFGRVFLAQELRGSGSILNTPKEASIATVSAADEPSAPLKADKPRPSSSSTRPPINGGAIWTTEFSIDGKYLAAAGQDQVVRIWSVISTPKERAEQEKDEDSSANTERLSTPVFKSKPLREFSGHTATVLDLSWSKNNFLISSSIDKTVRLWHISREECLCTFKHKDFVTSIAFHPIDDRFFLAGSLDGVLRLWSIPDKNVAFWAKAPEMITSVGFVPDGRSAIAGGNSGILGFYETEGLKFTTQVHVRSSRGKNAKGSKITGIRTMVMPPNDPNGEVKILVSSNDSRIRIYNLRDKNMEMKLRGHENCSSQIRASFSEDGRYVICGSEDRRTYVWSLAPSEEANPGKDKHPVESFASHSDLVTTSIIAPTKTRLLLGASNDPIYDLCNPPPITLLSKAETESSGALPDTPSIEINSVPPTPNPSSAYLSRAKHEDGNIIVTASHNGVIKVFRQDCAATKRRNEMWETSSTFSKKIHGIHRQSTMLSRRSGSTNREEARSRRNSVGLGLGLVASRASAHSLGGGTMVQGGDDHILSWANSIQSSSTLDQLGLGNTSGMTNSISNRSIGTFTTVSAGPSTTVSDGTNRSDRSSSPVREPARSRWGTGRKSVSSINAPSINLPIRSTASDARAAQYRDASSAPVTTVTSPVLSPVPKPTDRSGSMGEASIRSGSAGREAAVPSIRKLSKDKDREPGGGLREPAPGGLLPTPSFQIKEDTGRRFWGLGGGKDKDKRSRRNSYIG